MSQADRFELAGDHFLTHPLEQAQCGSLAAAPQDLAASGGKGRFGDDVGFDAGRKPFRPGLVVAFNGSQALFFPDQRINVADPLLHAHLPPFQVRPEKSDQLELSLDVPFRL